MKNYLRKLMALTAVSALVLGCFASCGSKNNTAGGKGDTLVIGGIGPLTGDYATYGISVKKGAEIAVDEINAAGGVGGINFKLLFEDDETDATKAVNAYGLLMDQGMQVSLGAVTSGACIAVTEEAKNDGILMLTPSGSQKECTQFDNCFRICFQDPDQGTYSADYISDHSLANKVAVIYDKSNDYSVGIEENFVKEAKAKGLEIATIQAFTDQSNTDFSAQLQKVKESGADLLFLPIYAQEAAFILKQSKDAGLDISYFGCDGLDGIIEKLGGESALADGVMLLTPFAADAEDETTKKFVEAFKSKYNSVPDQFAADGYDAIYTIKAAIEKAGVTDTTDAELNEKLIVAMTEIKVNGLTGEMIWSSNGEPTKTAKAVKITNGAYTAL